MLAQRATGILIKFLDVVGHHVARQHAQTFDQSERKAPRKTDQGFVPPHRQQRFEMQRHLAVDEMLQPPAHLVCDIGSGLFVHERLDLRTRNFGPLDQLSDRRGAPHQAALRGEVHLGVGRVVEAVRAQMEFGLQHRLCRLAQRARLVGRRGRILPEPEPFQTPDKFAGYRHFTFVIHLGHEGLLLLQPP